MEALSYFKDEIVGGILSVPTQNLSMGKLLDVMMWVDVVETKLIETPKGRSYEGQYLTGYKLRVQLKLKEKMSYLEQEITQSAYAIHYETLKSLFITMPQEIEGKSVQELYRANRITVVPSVEGICSRMLDERTVYRCAMLSVQAKVV